MHSASCCVLNSSQFGSPAQVFVVSDTIVESNVSSLAAYREARVLALQRLFAQIEEAHFNRKLPLRVVLICDSSNVFWQMHFPLDFAAAFLWRFLSLPLVVRLFENDAEFSSLLAPTLHWTYNLVPAFPAKPTETARGKFYSNPYDCSYIANDVNRVVEFMQENASKVLWEYLVLFRKGKEKERDWYVCLPAHSLFSFILLRRSSCLSS